MKEPGTSSYESLQDEIRNIVTPAIEVFKNIYQDRLYRVSFSVPEFSAICPKTSLPDYGKLLPSIDKEPIIYPMSIYFII